MMKSWIGMQTRLDEDIERYGQEPLSGRNGSVTNFQPRTHDHVVHRRSPGCFLRGLCGIRYNRTVIMKKSYLLSACSVVAMLLWQPALTSAQQDPREVLDRAIETLGGSAYLDVVDMSAEGRLYQFQRGELIGAEVFADYVKYPDRERTEFGEDRETVRINNGQSEGWNVNEGEVQAQLEDQVELFWEEFKVSLDHVLRVVVDQPDTTLQYVGREMIDFKRVDILEIRDEDRTRVNLYIDRESGLLMKKSVRRLDDPRIHDEVYSNYHVFQDVLTPLLIDRYTDGLKTMEVRYDTVAYNTNLPDRLFMSGVDR